MRSSGGNPSSPHSLVAQRKYSRGLLPPRELRMRPPSPKGVCMTRAEFLEAATERLSEVIILLTAAGEDCLALEVEAIADRVEFRAIPVAVKKRKVGLER